MLLREVAARLPRGDFSREFAAAIHAQALRKPSSAAARLDRAGRVPSGAERWDAILA